MPSSCRVHILLLVGTALVAGDLGRARAQSVDYGSLEQLFGEPVTTSAVGKPQRVSQVPVNMEIVTQDDIRRSGADNIPDVLQFVTGLDFRRSSFNEGEVSIRGYDQPWNPRLLVLVNDRPVYEDFYGDVVWAALPVQLDEIRQIEIVKGPNSALFGFNAASGVINIVTYDPLLDSTNAVTVRTGTQSLAEGSAVVTYHAGTTFGLRLSAGGLSADEFDRSTIPAENATGLLHPQDGTLNFDSRWQVTPNIVLGLEGNVGEMKRNFPADDTPEDDRTNTIRGFVTASTAIGTVGLDLYKTVWWIDYLGGQAQQAVDTAYDLRLSDLFKGGLDNTFRINFEYKNNSATGQFLSGSTIGYSVYSLGGMWNWQITPALSLTNAVRADYLQLSIDGPVLPQTGLTARDFNDTDLNAVSFNSGLVWGITDVDVLRLTASRGFQLPSLDDLGQQIVGGGVVLVGDPHLTPTSVLNFEIDYDRTLEPLGAVLRTALFTQRNSNLFGYDVGAPVTLGRNVLFPSANIGESNETGFEIGLKSTPAEAVRWKLSYQYASISDHIHADIAPGAYSAFQSGTPKHVVDFGIGYSLDRWEFDLQGRWQSSFLDYRFTNGVYGPVAINDYLTMNGRIGYRLLDHVTVAGTVEQFDEARIYERASVPTERRAIVSVTANF